MAKIRRSVLENIIAHARQEIPIEACGYLAGDDEIISSHYKMKNIDNSPEHFTFDVQEQFSVLRKIRSQGLTPLAVYHSHPITPARPSIEDIKLAVDPDVSYVIVSLAEGKEQVKTFKIRNGVVENEGLEVIE